MSYAPQTDFLALARLTASGVELGRMPGLDYVIAALSRAGFIALWTGATAPTTNTANTVWLKPASPSWSAEGAVYLYDASIEDFAPATPALWAALLAGDSAGNVFQSVTNGAGVVNSGTTLLAVQRTILTPLTTELTLPALSVRAGAPLRIVDWSTVAAEHIIELSTPDGATIMRRTSWSLYSTADQLSGVTLYPSTDLDGWVITP